MTEEVQQKKCPACAEFILADAKKCKHCGEWMSVTAAAADTTETTAPATESKVEAVAITQPSSQSAYQPPESDSQAIGAALGSLVGAMLGRRPLPRVLARKTLSLLGAGFLIYSLSPEWDRRRVDHKDLEGWRRASAAIKEQRTKPGGEDPVAVILGSNFSARSVRGASRREAVAELERQRGNERYCNPQTVDDYASAFIGAGGANCPKPGEEILKIVPAEEVEAGLANAEERFNYSQERGSMAWILSVVGSALIGLALVVTPGKERPAGRQFTILFIGLTLAAPAWLGYSLYALNGRIWEKTVDTYAIGVLLLGTLTARMWLDARKT